MPVDIKLRFFKALRERGEAKDDFDAKDKLLQGIKAEIEERNPQIAMTVSDHAIVQYLIRCYNMEDTIHKARNEILHLIDEAGDPEPQNRGNQGEEQYVYDNMPGPNNTELKAVVKNNNVVTTYITEKPEQNGNQ